MNRVKKFNKQVQKSANRTGKQINKAINKVITGVQAPVVGNGKMMKNDNQPLPSVSSNKPTTFQ